MARHALLCVLLCLLHVALVSGAKYKFYPLSSGDPKSNKLFNEYGDLASKSLVKQYWTPTHIVKIFDGKNKFYRLASNTDPKGWALDLSPDIEEIDERKVLMNIDNNHYGPFKKYLTGEKGLEVIPEGASTNQAIDFRTDYLKMKKRHKYNFEHLVGPWMRKGLKWVQIGLIKIKRNQLGGGLAVPVKIAVPGGGTLHSVDNFVGGNAMSVALAQQAWPANPLYDQQKAQEALDKKAHDQQVQADNIAKKKAKKAAQAQRLAEEAEEAERKRIADEEEAQRQLEADEEKKSTKSRSQKAKKRS